MSAKRQATTDLNHDNWDRVEEPEERGTFRVASADELKNRVIKKAQRKISSGSGDAKSTDKDATDSGNGTTKSLFSGFTGFKNTGTAAPFSFLAKIPSVAAAAASSTSTSSPPTKPTFSFGNATSTSGASTFTFGSNVASSSTSSSSSTSKSTPLNTVESKNKALEQETGKSQTYAAKIKGLNLAVTDWIKSHVDKNPLCILTPIFKDYEKYLTDIEKEENQNSNKGEEKISATPVKSSTPTTTSASTSSLPAKPFSFMASIPNTVNMGTTSSCSSIFSGLSQTGDNKSNGFMSFKPVDPAFSTSSSTTTGAPATLFNFVKPTTTLTTTTSIASAPFTFSNVKPPVTATESEKTEDDEDDEPPKVEFKEVVEEDAIYSKKCKVFVKKDNNYTDCGVGTLYLKPVSGGSKTQLLVRADTNLGNILVNMILSEGIPAKRMGKNNVMLVGLPTPAYTKPTSMLLRVKTGDDADELLASIEKYQK